MISRAKNHPGDAGQQRQIFAHHDDLGAEIDERSDVERIANDFINQFISGKIDSVHVAYMNFISTSTQRAEVLTLLPGETR